MMTIGAALLLAGLGILVGGFGTLIGAGGGFILVPVLLLVYPNTKPELITSISLAVVFFNATSGSIAYARMKRIDYRSALAFAAATLPGSIIGALATSYIARHTFDIILGALLLIISGILLIKPSQGAYVIIKKHPGHTERTLIEKNGEEHHYTFSMITGIIISFFVGFLSSLLGIGGGIIHVPALTAILNFPVHIATATSHFILAIMALAGTVVHILQGNFKNGWLTTILIGAGVIIGAQFGARLSDRIRAQWIIRALAIALLLVGIRLLFK